MFRVMVSSLPNDQLYSANNLPEDYLRGRPNAKYNRSDFDSLSNKFLSKLVIRAN